MTEDDMMKQIDSTLEEMSISVSFDEKEFGSTDEEIVNNSLEFYKKVILKYYHKHGVKDIDINFCSKEVIFNFRF